MYGYKNSPDKKKIDFSSAAIIHSQNFSDYGIEK